MSGGKSKPLDFSYDEERDVMTVEGLKITGTLFRCWAEDGFPVGAIFQVISRKRGFDVRRFEAVERLQGGLREGTVVGVKPLGSIDGKLNCLGSALEELKDAI